MLHNTVLSGESSHAGFRNKMLHNLTQHTSCETDVERIINDPTKRRLLWDHCNIYESPTDGHCLLHSVISSLKLQLMPTIELTIKSLLDIISREISTYPERYLVFIEGNDIHTLQNGFYQYAYFKHYDSDFGDLVPTIICNALNICLVLISRDVNEDCLTTQCINSDKGRTVIFLHKNSEHYNALIPIE